MASAKQIAANRRNAKHSTGPRTPAGKEITRLNALRHGLTGTAQAFLPDEDPAAFDALRARLRSELAPQSALEEGLVDQIASLLWRIARAERLEVAVLTQQVFERRRQLAYREAHEMEWGTGRGLLYISADDTETESRYNEVREREKAAEVAQRDELAMLGHAYAEQAPTLDKLQRYEAQLRRHLERTLVELDRVQGQRLGSVEATARRDPGATPDSGAQGETSDATNTPNSANNAGGQPDTQNPMVAKGVEAATIGTTRAAEARTAVRGDDEDAIVAANQAFSTGYC
jgi:hypothetical protein